MSQVSENQIDSTNQSLANAAAPQSSAPGDLERMLNGKQTPVGVEVTAIERKVRVRKTSPLDQNLSPGKRILEHQLADVQQNI